MKKVFTTLVVAAAMLFLTLPAMAQTTHPGEPGGDPQLGGDPPLGGGAPIGGGTFILLGLGAAYGGKKLYHLKQEIEENGNPLH